MSGSDDYLDALANVFTQIGQMLDLGRERYDADPAVRLAIQRLWIAAGECARLYCGASGTQVGVEPWSSLWGYRNVLVHHLPDDIDDNLVWVESVRDLPEYRSVVDGLRQGP